MKDSFITCCSVKTAGKFSNKKESGGAAKVRQKIIADPEASDK